ncbi:Propionate catabolism operon regulatory protein [Burkholderia pseudomallei]|nr:Propionate catabolism operon regulatory protein [Burkholderia pseudomallei]CAJ4568961.1 Propionate catabolism operon regulatory protein [Burkholderia pseudomallei]CAJ5212867.1 Propionate catabolism operon regulatory protein [Burkholderia pseudomallei]CAJ5815310.1 Propionate catabolism operon regulatory protein [Burkholderia pseudomallei]CAJ7001554.1 Propionate catabolism operon regulatory protein [Burkholderia pseudomallei]
MNAAQPHPRSANPSPALLPAAAAQAATSAASADSDAQLRPLADRIRALQSETIDLRRAADAQMRRVNRLLLALAVVLLAAIVAWIVQAVQLSRQRDQFAAIQQRIDRLVAAQATQGATIATLSQRQDEVGAQVDRLTSRLSSTAVPAKRAHRTRHMR